MQPFAIWHRFMLLTRKKKWLEYKPVQRSFDRVLTWHSPDDCPTRNSDEDMGQGLKVCGLYRKGKLKGRVQNVKLGSTLLHLFITLFLPVCFFFRLFFAFLFFVLCSVLFVCFFFLLLLTWWSHIFIREEKNVIFFMQKLVWNIFCWRSVHHWTKGGIKLAGRERLENLVNRYSILQSIYIYIYICIYIYIYVCVCVRVYVCD